MAISRVHTWSAGEVLLASDLNSEFNNVLNNAADLVSPFTKAISMGGFALNFDAANTMSITSGTKGLNLSSTTAINDVFTTVTSAATPDIWTAIGGVINYTGSTTATGFAAAPQAGARRTLVCAAAAPFTAGANVLIDGVASGSTFTAAVGDVVDVIAVTTTQFRLKLRLAGTTPALRSYLAGLTLSTAGSSATMSIAAGQATDSTNNQLMTLASSIGKTTSAWAVGTGNGGLDTGAIATSTWYHFYLIMRPDTGVVDVLFSTSASAPTMPTNYTLKRRIGSGKTDGSSNWTSFTQDGDLFELAAPVLDVNTTNPGTSAVTSTLSVPTGVNVTAWYNGYLNNATSSNPVLYFSDLAVTDAVPSTAAGSVSLQGQAAAAGAVMMADFYTRTNTSAQIRYRLSASGASDVVHITTKGWSDRRGRDS